MLFRSVMQKLIPAMGHAWEGTGCIRCDATRENDFSDVPEDSFYINPVLWAVEKGITNGLTDTTFGPTAECNRAQVVTFLWRAAGSPEPTSTTNPFTDVKESDFYYKAVLWAVEKGITNGLTADTFGPFALQPRPGGHLPVAAHAAARTHQSRQNFHRCGIWKLV